MREHTSGTSRMATGPEPQIPRHAIPFGRPLLSEAERAAVMEVLEGPLLTHGPRVVGFEAAFAEFTGAAHAVATNS